MGGHLLLRSELIPWRTPMNAATLLLARAGRGSAITGSIAALHPLFAAVGGRTAVHHSSSGYTVATAYRVSFVNQLIAPVFYLPCIVLGSPRTARVVGLQILGIHYQA